ncbi:uncharacterized protein FOBCDRAFT_104912, partial [Fusarium oxysporum Fo47]|uniref:uncharacterized protein n=1 Tax=Fusarium oxysporum Fo47 TaxID=660027 RepID=UPI002869A030
TYRHETVHQIINFLTHGRPPNLMEVAYCTNTEATEHVASGDEIIITKDQLSIDWGGCRPIESLLTEWLTLSHNSKDIMANLPHCLLTQNLKETKKIGSARRKILHNEPSNESWMFLNLFNPLPMSSPGFLNNPNAQHLQYLEDKQGKDATRRFPYGILLSEGGQHTGSHIDFLGTATSVTVHEGTYGFGWIHVRDMGDLDAWTQDPLSVDVGRMARYVVLHPGQTVYMPSGTIHFIFRKQ